MGREQTDIFIGTLPSTDDDASFISLTAMIQNNRSQRIPKYSI
jgi:hypothetical protein